jgi:hypothetical protein
MLPELLSELRGVIDSDRGTKGRFIPNPAFEVNFRG